MRILHLTKSRRGSAGITYGLVVGLIAVVAVTAVQQVGGAISGLTNATAGKIEQATAEPMCPQVTLTCVQRGGGSIISDPNPLPESRYGTVIPVTLMQRGSTDGSAEAHCAGGSWDILSAGIRGGGDVSCSVAQ